MTKIRRKRDAINADIQEIFARHSIDPGAGEEAFWNATDAVEKLDLEDGIRLRVLALEWEEAEE